MIDGEPGGSAPRPASERPRGDQVRVSVRVRVPSDEAFRLFTEEIDPWWRRGLKFRASGANPGVMHLEPRVGGRLYEEIGERRTQVAFGTVLVWEPPERLVLEWRNVNFTEDERTEVEVEFVPTAGGDATLVTVTHRGWSAIRPDHPVRHGLKVDAFIHMTGMRWNDLMVSFRERAAEAGGG